MDQHFKKIVELKKELIELDRDKKNIVAERSKNYGETARLDNEIDLYKTEVSTLEKAKDAITNYKEFKAKRIKLSLRLGVGVAALSYSTYISLCLLGVISTSILSIINDLIVTALCGAYITTASYIDGTRKVKKIIKKKNITDVKIKIEKYSEKIKLLCLDYEKAKEDEILICEKLASIDNQLESHSAQLLNIQNKRKMLIKEILGDLLEQQLSFEEEPLQSTSKSYKINKIKQKQ